MRNAVLDVGVALVAGPEARGRECLGAAHTALVTEEAQDLAFGTAGAGCEQSRPALFRELLADALVG